MDDQIANLDPGGTLPLAAAFDVVVRQRALRETGRAMTVEAAHAWYRAERAERESQTAG